MPGPTVPRPCYLILSTIPQNLNFSCQFYAAASRSLHVGFRSISQIKVYSLLGQPLHGVQDSFRSRIVAPAARYAHRFRYDPKLSHVGLQELYNRQMLEVTGSLLGMPSSFHQNMLRVSVDSPAASRRRLAALFWSSIRHFRVGPGGHDRSRTRSRTRPGVVVECDSQEWSRAGTQVN